MFPVSSFDVKCGFLAIFSDINDDDGVIFPFVNLLCHLKQSIPYCNQSIPYLLYSMYKNTIEVRGQVGEKLNPYEPGGPWSLPLSPARFCSES